ncbi:MAG: DUF6273 domain-containing protein [Lachnospiraceae bacterium]|nr:DUF6273 domain-containing protein [Lachnospiraceae bacterium]
MKKKVKKILAITIIAVVSIIAIAVAAFLIWNKWRINHRDYSDVRIAEVKGNAVVIRDGEYLKLYDNIPLETDDEIILYQGTLLITVDQSMVLCLEDGTDITLWDQGGEDGYSTNIKMTSGAITGRVFPNAVHKLNIYTSSCGIITAESIFRIYAPYDGNTARISSFDGETAVYLTSLGGFFNSDEKTVPMERELYFGTEEVSEDSSEGSWDFMPVEIDYDTIPTQGVSYLQLLSEGTESDRLRDFLAATAEELAHTYVHTNKSNGERDTVLAIGEAEAVLDDVEAGDYVFFGRFNQGFNAGDEKIEWLVLDKEDGAALLVSRYALASDCYDQDMSPSGKEYLNWKNSNTREWLNTDFYENAFFDEEKALILCSGDGVEDDNVFLLSESDIMEYFNGKTLDKNYSVSDPVNYNASLVLYPCEMVSVPGSSKGSCNWLLRTFSENRKVKIVNEYGAIATADPDDYMGIRPAIYLEYKE